MSHRAASLRASSSLFFFSPLLTRQFSSSTNWPGLTSTPSTQLATTGTSKPSSSPMRRATGFSESSGLNSPSVGRPRCEVTITAAPACRASLMAGMEARMRVSSVIWPASSCGTLRSARMKTRWPDTLPAATRSEKRRTFMMGRELGWRTNWEIYPRSLPTQADPQPQHHRRTAQYGAQNPPLPEEIGRAHGHGIEPRVLPGRDQLPLGHDDLGHDHRRQRGQRRIAQALPGPGRHGQLVLGNHEEAARQQGDQAHADDAEGNLPVAHDSTFCAMPRSGSQCSITRPTATATAIATMMLSRSGRAWAATAAQPATAPVTQVLRSLSSE